VKTVKLFVEGGGDSKSLRTECRAAFSSFLLKSGLSGFMPRVIASGSRNSAYSDYCAAILNGELAVLLVDSETEIILPTDDLSFDIDNPRTWKPWHHLLHRQGQTGEVADPWKKPSAAVDDDCHLMVQLMESWYLADITAMKEYFGNGFNERALPNRTDIENIPKDTVLASLHEATKNTRKGSYNKGNHAFGILAVIDPNKVKDKSPWAKRFVTLLSEKMQGVR